MDQSTVAYRTTCYFPVKEGTEGGLFFGMTFLNAALVGDEYNMTKGHYHHIDNRGEFYWGIEGEGVLVLMDRNQNTECERIFPGSLHYIPGSVAHRIVNTGAVTMVVGACWPSDAGHNYAEIAERGFGARVKCVDGKPQIIK